MKFSMDLRPKSRMLIVAISSAVLICSVTGCVSRSRYETDNALLLQENQKLEQALYLTHYQLSDAQRENTALRQMSLAVPPDDNASSSSVMPSGAISVPRRRTSRSENTEPIRLDEAPAFAPSAIPSGSGSSTPPDFLQQGIPTPQRPAVPSVPSSLGRPPRLAGVVPTTVIDASSIDSADVSSGFPQWQPTR